MAADGSKSKHTSKIQRLHPAEAMNELDSMDFMEEDFAPIKTGQIIKGTIISFDSSGAVVDIGYKSEGLVPITQFHRNAGGTYDVKVGDTMDVFVQQLDTDSGLVALSKNIADQQQGWKDLQDSFQNRTLLEAKVLSNNKSGYIVEYRSIQGFMPLSQAGLAPAEKAEALLGKMTKVNVIDFDQRHNKLIFSRKHVIEEQRQSQKLLLLETLKEGTKIKGKIKTITSYGAFVDIGGMDGLLHISDIAWKPIKSAEQVIKQGQEVEVMVLKIDKETSRISLGLKQLTENPWDKIEDKFPIGSIVNGKVTALTEYGAFIELESGIEGMVHISEMSWTKRINHPSEVVAPGQVIPTKVLNIDKTNRRIALGIRQTQADPWEQIEQKYPVGGVVKGTVSSVSAIGAILQVEEGVEGFVHQSDFSWTKLNVVPTEELQVGQEVEARVIKLSGPRRKMGLGIKQMTSDPWLAFFKKYKEGSVVTGKVTKIAEFGVFVDLEGGIEGLCRISQLDPKRITKIQDFCKIGDEFEFKIIRLQKAQKHLTLSRRTLLEDEERTDLKQYLGNRTPIKTNLGQLFQEVSSGSSETTEENQ